MIYCYGAPYCYYIANSDAFWGLLFGILGGRQGLVVRVCQFWIPKVRILEIQNNIFGTEATKEKLASIVIS